MSIDGGLRKGRRVTPLDIVIFLLVFSGPLIFGVNRLFFNREGYKKLFIKTEKGEYYYSLNQEKTIDIEGKSGITRVEIDNGRFRFTNSPCSHKICINQGWVNTPNLPVICLPNMVTAYIHIKDKEYDGVSR